MLCQAKEKAAYIGPRKQTLTHEQDKLEKEPQLFKSIDSLSKGSSKDHTQIQLTNAGVDHLNTEFEGDNMRSDQSGGIITKQKIGNIEIIKKRGADAADTKATDTKATDTKATDLAKKIDYRRTLELQILEKTLNKTHTEQVRKLEDRIEELKASRDHFKTELDKKSASPQTKEKSSKIPPNTEPSKPLSGKNGFDQATPDFFNKRQEARTEQSKVMDRTSIIQEEIVLLRQELKENSLRLQAEIAKFKVI